MNRQIRYFPCGIFRKINCTEYLKYQLLHRIYNAAEGITFSSKLRQRYYGKRYFSRLWSIKNIIIFKQFESCCWRPVCQSLFPKRSKEASRRNGCLHQGRIYQHPQNRWLDRFGHSRQSSEESSSYQGSHRLPRWNLSRL